VDLSKQDIEDLETQLDPKLRLQQLERINLEGNQLESIPPAVFNRLLKLVHLDVSHNRIAKLSFPYFRDPCLKILKVAGNCLGSLNL
jgi:Leucine-rich repeat (LRR) protein